MGQRVFKTDIVKAVADDTGLSEHETSRVVNSVLGNISQRLQNGDSVTITGFGTFKVTGHPARQIRAIGGANAGQMIDVPAKRRVSFKAGKAISDAVQT